MKSYELALVLRSSLKEENQKKLIEEVKGIISKDGKVLDEKSLGRKSLAFKMNKETNGVFFVLNFEANPEVPVNITNKLRIEEDVLRFLMEQKIPAEKVTVEAVRQERN